MNKALKIVSCAALAAVPVIGYKIYKNHQNNDVVDINLCKAVEEPVQEVKTVRKNSMPTYVVNERTKKFHTANCRMLTVADDVIHKTPAQLQAEGYIPCKVCNPDKE